MSNGYGKFIKNHRIASGFKRQKTFAEITGISSATISRIEREIQKPEVRTLQTIAQYLPSTSFVELMEVCDYVIKDKLSLTGTIVELSDSNLLEEFNLRCNGETLTRQELKIVIALINALRQS